MWSFLISYRVWNTVLAFHRMGFQEPEREEIARLVATIVYVVSSYCKISVFAGKGGG